jgi:D-alanyl-D-alanine carboxypeptidase
MSQQTVTLPVTGTITNTNFLLDHDEIVGMKTGYNPEAGGVFVLAGRHSVDEHAQDIVTVVMGAPGGASRVAQQDAYTLYASAKENFSYLMVHYNFVCYYRHLQECSEYYHSHRV